MSTDCHKFFQRFKIMGKKKSFDWSLSTTKSSDTSSSSTQSSKCELPPCTSACPAPCPPPCPPTCLPPIVTFVNRPPSIHNHFINRPGRDVQIEHVCKIENTTPIASSYSPSDHVLAVGFDSKIEIYKDTCCPLAVYNLPAGQTLEVLDFDSGIIVYGSSNGAQLFLTILNYSNATFTQTNTTSFVGTSFKSLKLYECLILVSYRVGSNSNFDVFTYPTLHPVKSYTRCTTHPVDFLYIHVCNSFVLLSYDNTLELIKTFDDVGTITTTPSLILSVSGAYCFESFNLVVGCKYNNEVSEPSLLTTPTLTLTPGDTANLRFYYVNYDGLYIKGKTHIIGDPESLSVSPNKKTLAVMVGTDLILYDITKWCDIRCGTAIFLGSPTFTNIIWKRNSKFIVTNTNTSQYNNLIWFDVSCID